MQTIYLDISNKGVIPTIYAKQGDVGRRFLAVLTDAGVPYSPPAGSAFSVWYDGDSGAGNYTDIGGSSAFSVNANTVSVELITQMLEKNGEGVLCLVLSRADGKQISLWNIPYTCEFVPGYESEEANSYFTAFSDAVKNLPYPDTSLSVPGKAADSGAVGTALASKAPAGFGLGELIGESGIGVCTTSEEVDALRSNGWYVYWNANIPLFSFDTGINNIDKFGLIRVDSGAWSQRQTFIPRIYPQYTLLRYAIDAGTWSEWEWVNPPVVAGVEYRTTERWNGKPVYTMLVNCGTTAAGQTETKTTISDASYDVIRMHATRNVLPLPWINGTAEGDYSCHARMNTGDGYYWVQIWQGASSSSGQAYAQIFYCEK